MRMNCVGCEPELAARASGELDAATRDAVDAHLADCEHCRAELARELELRAGLAGLPLVPCPEAVSARVLAAVGRDEARTRRRRLRWGVAAATLAVAATLAGVALLRPGGGASRAGGTVARTAPAPDRQAPAATALPRSPAPALPADSPYTAAQVASARRDLVRAMTLTAVLLDRAGRNTLADVFSTRLPAAVAGALRPLDDTTRGG